MRLSCLVLVSIAFASPVFSQTPAAPAAATAVSQPATATPAAPATAAPASGAAPAVAAPATGAPAVATATASAPAAAASSAAAAKTECPDCKNTADAYWWAFWVVTGFIAIGLVVVIGGLASGQWSLTDALADKEAQLTRTKQRLILDKGTRTLTPDPQHPADKTTVPAASASRLIALVGTLMLTGIMLGVGYGMIWSLFTRGEVPKLDGIGPYLLGGSALFAPYAFNQLKEAFKPRPDANQITIR